jgi:LPS O-antigen subunit length determinant protein (WzzB/FepE family)
MMTSQEQVTEQKDEISLFDIVDFFITYTKTILTTSILGLMTAGLYLWFTPPQYEAVAQIQMAQWSSNKNLVVPTGNTESSNKNLVVPTGNVEEAVTLISRLSVPSTYSVQNIQACKMEYIQIDQDLALTKKLKYATIKTVPNVIEIKVKQKSKDDAIACLQSVFENIRLSQSKIAEPIELQATQLIEEKNNKLALAKQLIFRGDQSGPALSAVYLSTRDEINILRYETEILNYFMNSKDSRSTRLISPIYAAEKPVSPKKLIILIAGLFGGLCLGIVYVLLRKGMKVFKKHRLEKLP